MTWDKLDVDLDAQRVAFEESRKEEAAALQRAARRAIASDEQKPLRVELEKIVRRASYTPGRSAEDTAYVEGTRKVAHDLLRLAGLYD